MTAGTLYGIGMGPGDPELLTLKAARLIGAVRTVAYFAKRGRPGHARRIAGNLIGPATEELRFEYPFTTERPVDDPAYQCEMTAFYDRAARDVCRTARRGP